MADKATRAEACWVCRNVEADPRSASGMCRYCVRGVRDTVDRETGESASPGNEWIHVNSDTPRRWRLRRRGDHE